MPTVFLSPSLQEFNEYVTGNGSEARFMQQLAEDMIPGLLLNGIAFRRSGAGDTVQSAIDKSNAYGPDLHIALHSNAAPTGLQGRLQGPEIYYFKDSERGRRAAENIGTYLAQVYPYADVTEIIPADDELAELRRTKAPAVFIETAYHDNPQDAAWIETNLQSIANAIVHGVTEYFDLPYTDPTTFQTATVQIDSGSLNLRAAPSMQSAIIGKLQDGESVVALRRQGEWTFVLTAKGAGYAASRYLSLS